MAHFLGWVGIILIGWVIVSAVVTPLVGRWLGNRFSGPVENKSSMKRPISSDAHHDNAGL